MAREVERKFLVSKEVLNTVTILKTKDVEQFYVEISDEREVRYRKANGKYFRTIKEGNGIAREEIEVEVSEEEYSQALPQAVGNVIRKTRYVTDAGEEIDVYKESFEGLVVLEMEFEDEEAASKYVPPEGAREVTNDKRYKNKYLALKGKPE